MKQLTDKLNTAMAELSNEKSNNMMLMNSYTLLLEKYQKLESEHRSHDGYEGKMEEIIKAFDRVLAEKNDILQQYLL